MSDRLDFDAARRVLDEVVPTDTWDEATLRAATGSLVQLDPEDASVGTVRARSRSRTIRLAPIAAGVLAVAGVAAIVAADRQAVDTAGGPTTLAQGVVEFVEAPITSGCCVPPGGGLPVPAGQGLGGQTMEITAVEEDGEVTGEARLTMYDVLDTSGDVFEVVVELECANTDTGDVILGGTVTSASGENHSGNFPPVGALMSVIIREGEPDRVAVWWTTQASSCPEALESVPEPRPDDRFVEVVDGDDIETG